MKTKEEYQACVDELKTVCDKHGIYIVGSDFSEGIIGEIALFEKEDPLLSEEIRFINFKVFKGWKNWYWFNGNGSDCWPEEKQ